MAAIRLYGKGPFIGYDKEYLLFYLIIFRRYLPTLSGNLSTQQTAGELQQRITDYKSELTMR
jgi:hypothetical protein